MWMHSIPQRQSIIPVPMEDDIEQGNYTELVGQLKDSIFDCAKSIKSNDETFKISTLPEVSGKLKELMAHYVSIMQRVEASQQTFMQLLGEVKCDLNRGNDGDAVNLATFEDLFKQTYESQLRATTAQTQSSDVLNSILGTRIVRDEDIVEEEPRERQCPKDPITKTNIKKAVRSKQCKHTYDKRSIEEYISQKERSKSSRIACPVAGCVNKTLTRQDLEPDDEANNIIESFRS